MSGMENVRNGLAVLGGVTLGAGVYVLAREAWLKHRDSRAFERVVDLERRLKDSEQRASKAETALASLGAAVPPSEKKLIRVYMDGCFDLMHYGHCNALRQVVGLSNDEEVEKYKGSRPLIPEEERYTTLASCKWVDEVIRNAPYEVLEEFVPTLFDTYKIDYIVHGDDPVVTPDGRDGYELPKQMGCYRTIKRTEGISTTDIVGRMLLMTREHHIVDESSPAVALHGDIARLRSTSFSESIDELSRFLPTSRRIMQFASGEPPRPDQRIVYMLGSFDVFHSGHVDALRAARSFGDYVIVGVLTDRTVNKVLGSSFPILNLHERVLSVLACRYVDEVIIGAPMNVTRDLLVSMNVSVVVAGSDSSFPPEVRDQMFAVPREMGIYQEFPSPRALSVRDIIQRILADRKRFEDRYKSKSASAAAYYKDKTYVPEL